jgi:signal transduction histidine kinase
MRLADFISQDIDSILNEWDSFAATLLPAARNTDSVGLRDHARQILQAVVTDISTPQTNEQQREKSVGRVSQSQPAGNSETAAQTHALLRARGGFNINQIVAEYRALRASVLRLWLAECQPLPTDLDDVIRFNEAIDQAIAESVGFFDAQVERARNLLLGMLGHDMRSPLQTIQTTAAYLAELNAGKTVSDAAGRLIRSGIRMNALLDDLCDFNRTKLGLGINIARTDVDLGAAFADEVDQLRAAHPDRRIDLEISGDLRGNWDCMRLQQLLSNLVLNALSYGAHDEPVRVVVTGADAAVRFEVRNSGAVIDRQTLKRIFDPLSRGPEQQRKRIGGLGLGLFIANEIAKAHQGAIEGRSDEAGTVFAVQLPRNA